MTERLASGLAQLRAAVAAELKERIPFLASSDTHGGPVTVETLESLQARMPSALTVALGAIDGTLEGGQPTIDFRWATFVVCKDMAVAGQLVKRDALALALVEHVLAAVIGNRWNSEVAKMPREIRATNFHSPKLDEMAVALWAVTWRQAIDCVPFDASTLDDFLRLVATYDLAEPGPLDEAAEDQVELDGP